MKFEVYRTLNKQWRWRLRASNGKLIANAGESYKRKIDCNTEVKRIMNYSFSAKVVEVKK